jgi:hypothetical protein
VFHRIRQRIRDVHTVKKLCVGAERHALEDQQREPGAEHFLLSALELPDGSAQRVFERLNADPAGLRDAIARQYSDALRHVGIDPAQINGINDELKPLSGRRGLYEAAPSGKAVMQELAALREHDKEIPLLGAHVVAVIATMGRGVAARSLRAMGIDLGALGAAANAEIKATR